MASPRKSAAAWGGECKAEERLQLSGDMAALNPSSLWVPLLRGSSPNTTTTAGRMQAEKHRSALARGPIQASGALPGHGIAQHQPRLGSLRRRAVPDARLELSSR